MVPVSDTGTSIPPAELAKVFEPFFTTKAPGKGTGLGLSMVYGYAKQSRGHVNIYSEVGKGMTIRVYFPRARRNQAAALPIDISATPSLAHETVLIVEDNRDVRQTAREPLQSLGH